MSTPKAIIGLFLIFFLGIATGVALSVKLTDARIRQLTTGGPDILADMVVRRLGRQLQLTAPQREKLYAVTKETMQKMGSAEPNPTSSSLAVTDAAVEKIRAILTPEQVTQFNAIVEESKRAKTEVWRQD